MIAAQSFLRASMVGLLAAAGVPTNLYMSQDSNSIEDDGGVVVCSMGNQRAITRDLYEYIEQKYLWTGRTKVVL